MCLDTDAGWMVALDSVAVVEYVQCLGRWLGGAGLPHVATKMDAGANGAGDGPDFVGVPSAWGWEHALMFQRRCQGGSVVPEAMASRLRSMLCQQPVFPPAVANGAIRLASWSRMMSLPEAQGRGSGEGRHGNGA